MRVIFLSFLLSFVLWTSSTWSQQVSDSTIQTLDVVRNRKNGEVKKVIKVPYLKIVELESLGSSVRGHVVSHSDSTITMSGHFSPGRYRDTTLTFYKRDLTNIYYFKYRPVKNCRSYYIGRKGDVREAVLGIASVAIGYGVFRANYSFFVPYQGITLVSLGESAAIYALMGKIFYPRWIDLRKQN
jgi:hypothetical protein